MTLDDFKHNKWILLAVTFMVESAIAGHVYLEYNKITDQSLVNLGMMLVGVLTGSALTKAITPTPSTTIPDSSGDITVNTPTPVVVNGVDGASSK